MLGISAGTLDDEEDWFNMNLFIHEAKFRTIVSHYQSYVRHITAYIWAKQELSTFREPFWYNEW